MSLIANAAFLVAAATNVLLMPVGGVSEPDSPSRPPPQLSAGIGRGPSWCNSSVSGGAPNSIVNPSSGPSSSITAGPNPVSPDGSNQVRETLETIKTAAESGDALRQFKLAVCLLSKSDEEHNKADALIWFEKSAAHNYFSAQLELCEIKEGQNTNRISCYEKYASSNSIEMQNLLGDIYRKGTLVS